MPNYQCYFAVFVWAVGAQVLPSDNFYILKSNAVLQYQLRVLLRSFKQDHIRSSHNGVSRITHFYHVQCSVTLFQAFYFPEHAGLPLVSPSDGTPLSLRIEVHYDNPTHAEGKY